MTKSVCRDMAIRSAVRHIHGIMLTKLTRTERIRQRYKNMIKLRNSSKAFSIGDFECVHKVGHVYGFVRCYHDEKYLIVANLGTREERARVDVARYGMRKLKCQTSDDNSLLESSDGIHFIDIPRLWIKVYKVEK